MKLKNFFLTFIFFLTLDQISKILIRSHYTIGESKKIIGSFFKFTRVENPGAVFGITVGRANFNYYFFLLLTILAVFLIIYMFISTKNMLARFAFTLVLSGAIGNLIDRIAFRQVTDFLDVDFFDFIIPRWYTFNVADSCIVVGVMILLIYYIFFEKENNTQENGSQRRYNEV
ncbi:MAG: signal peptidase II [Candidatus Cloacimonetes bacterium]|nr:signal peptidase II [Candidatus Cloacimonadota bacterium]MBS3767601.1 signal peptidase II [Candidatus Cloacimonadota bacterium]